MPNLVSANAIDRTLQMNLKYLQNSVITHEGATKRLSQRLNINIPNGFVSRLNSLFEVKTLGSKEYNMTIRYILHNTLERERIQWP